MPSLDYFTISTAISIIIIDIVLYCMFIDCTICSRTM